MSYLSDRQIKSAVNRGNIKIIPYFDYFQGPSCYYCHLGKKFLVPKNNKIPYNPLLKNKQDDYFEEIITNIPIVLEPNKFILAEIFEMLGTDVSSVIRIFNSSSLARCGIGHMALGMVNPGCGYDSPVRLTLELVNNAPFPVILTPTTIMDGRINFGTEVLKISIVKMDKNSSQSYDKWHAQLFSTDKEVTSSKMYRRYEDMPVFKIGENFPYE